MWCLLKSRATWSAYSRRRCTTAHPTVVSRAYVFAIHTVECITAVHCLLERNFDTHLIITINCSNMQVLLWVKYYNCVINNCCLRLRQESNHIRSLSVGGALRVIQKRKKKHTILYFDPWYLLPAWMEFRYTCYDNNKLLKYAGLAMSCLLQLFQQ
jgi:hypothetical protein